ncbi:AAA family ATPase [Chryseolinea sp. H1M3-3]|uniref:AAA family ATPase n=1 Tax=Chryseolinea sp. H1M3-3 TaxID=3034144 RepID=UPI0023EC0D1A|nr:AAA family ATPase [Chryseolinea sp. H1M3-3]
MNRSEGKMVYFITGASGVGKTTLVTQLEEKYSNRPWSFLHFDTIGVPSLEEMREKFSSPVRWQEIKTHEWIDRIMHEYTDEKIFLEGQVNLEFIRSGFAKHHFDNYTIILIHCSEDEMRYRLTHGREQPELFNKHMINWLKFLRDQAKDFKAVVIDSSTLSKGEVLQKFEEALDFLH